jgi:hypothetical protein
VKAASPKGPLCRELPNLEGTSRKFSESLVHTILRPPSAYPQSSSSWSVAIFALQMKLNWMGILWDGHTSTESLTLVPIGLISAALQLRAQSDIAECLVRWISVTGMTAR